MEPAAATGGRSAWSAGAAAPWLIDALLAAAVATVLALIIATDQGGERPPSLVAYLFAAGFGGLMLLRRHLPLGALTLTVLALFAYYTLGYPPIGVALPVTVALFSVADAGRLGWAVVAGAVVCVVSFGFRIRDGEPLGYLLGYELISNLALIAAAVALGDGARARRVQGRQQAEIAQLQADRAARAVAERMHTERAAVSRDLHDTVGHTASVIAIHAGVAREALSDNPPAAAAALEQIRTASSRLLTELRDVVTVLRQDPPHRRQDAHRGPVTLAAVGDLLESARQAGLQVTLHAGTGDEVLPTAVDTTAYRIVQEAITNVIRHAAASRVLVSTDVVDGALRLLVRDDGSVPVTPEALRAGHGLQGMADRTRLLGGTLSTRYDHGFVVEALLPTRLTS